MAENNKQKDEVKVEAPKEVKEEAVEAVVEARDFFTNPPEFRGRDKKEFKNAIDQIVKAIKGEGPGF